MLSPPDLWLFSLLVAGIIALPGMDMAFVLSSTLMRGLPGGAAAIAGAVAGAAVHLVVGATGAAAVLVAVPTLFNGMLVAGAAYVAWLGLGMLRSAPAVPSASAGASPPALALPLAAVFRRALFTNLLNPKAYAFVLAVYPAFLRTPARPLVQQALLIGLITAACQVVIYGAVALGVGRASRGLQARPSTQHRMTQAMGLVLLIAAVLTVATAWRSP